MRVQSLVLVVRVYPWPRFRRIPEHLSQDCYQDLTAVPRVLSGSSYATAMLCYLNLELNVMN